MGKRSWMLAVIALGLMIGCARQASLPGKGIQFGDTYRILTETARPEVQNQTLRLQVGYSGCSGGHPFRLDYRQVDSHTAEMWLVHDGRGEMCEAYITETLTLELPDELLRYQSVMLHLPGADAMVLR